jgi:hypothetical protein
VSPWSYLHPLGPDGCDAVTLVKCWDRALMELVGTILEGSRPICRRALWWDLPRPVRLIIPAKQLIG